MRPSECKWCRCDTYVTDCDALRHFRCGSAYWPGTDSWTYTGECVGKCVSRAVASESRIWRALTLLKSAERYDTDEVDPETWCGDDVAQAVDADCVDQVIQILEGKSDGETD